MIVVSSDVAAIYSIQEEELELKFSHICAEV